jgi:hypothetical protein
MPIIQHWQPIYVDQPVRRIIGHLAGRVGGVEAFDSGDERIGLYGTQAQAEAAIFQAAGIRVLRRLVEATYRPRGARKCSGLRPADNAPNVGG